MSGPVYIVCGGTGGHLAPGIATAQRLMEAGEAVELVISEKEIDSRLLGAYPEISSLKSMGAPFSLKPVGLLKFVYRNLRSIARALRLLRKERPRVVLAFGGFLSVSYAIAAWILRIPVVLHEANRVVGRSIRFLSNLAEMVFLPEGVGLPGLEPRRLRHLGMPLRSDVIHIPKELIRGEMGIPMHAKVLVVVGGSQGAEVLNTWVENNYKFLAADGIWTILVSGPGKNRLPEVSVLQSEQGTDVELRTFPFHSKLNELFSCADVVLSRAGAGTIAELVTCLTPSILIPYPHAADNHQLANARHLERRGGGILIDQSAVETLQREVMDLIFNDWLLGRMRDNLRRLGRGDAARQLAAFIRRTYADPPSTNPSSIRSLTPDPGVRTHE